MTSNTKRPDTENFHLSFTAQLSTKLGSAGPVHVVIHPANGTAPESAELFGEHALLDAAWNDERPALHLYGEVVAIKVQTMNINNGSLIVASASILEAITAIAKRQQ